MPSTINGETADGWVQSYLQGTWAGLRQRTAPQWRIDDDNLRDVDAVTMYHTEGMRGSSYGMKRAFFDFDVSGITVEPTEATLNIRGHANGDLDVIAVRSDQGSSLERADFQAIAGAEEEFAASDGIGGGTLLEATGVKVYSAKFTSWNTSGYNQADITAIGLADISEMDNWRFCLMDYDYDFLDIDPPEAISYTGVFWGEGVGENTQPYIQYVPGTAAAAADNATFFGANF